MSPVFSCCMLALLLWRHWIQWLQQSSVGFTSWGLETKCFPQRMEPYLIIYPRSFEQQIFTVSICVLQSIQSSLSQLGTTRDKATHSSFSSGVLNLYPNFIHVWLLLNQQKIQKSPQYLLRMVRKEKVVIKKWGGKKKKGWCMVCSDLGFKNDMIWVWKSPVFIS